MGAVKAPFIIFIRSIIIISIIRKRVRDTERDEKILGVGAGGGRDRDRETETDRQTGRQADRQAYRHTEDYTEEEKMTQNCITDFFLFCSGGGDEL